MLTLIVGPMKSGKSLELLSRVAPHTFANKRVRYVQPAANARDSGIASRAGVSVEAHKVASLHKLADDFDVLAIDEIHMFPTRDVRTIERWLSQGKSVFATGLDLDYRGKMTPIVKKLLELKPEVTIAKHAVCDICREYTAQFTQILKNGSPILSGLPVVVLEDGTYEYQARCRNCFKKL